MALPDGDGWLQARRRAAEASPQHDEAPALAGASCDGATGTRTPDLLGAIQALSQLSYSPEQGGRNRAPAVQGRIVATWRGTPHEASRLDWRTQYRCYAPAPALFPRPVAALLRCDRRRTHDRGRARAVPAARRERTTSSSIRTLAQAQKGAQNLYKEARGRAMAAAGPMQDRCAARVGDPQRGPRGGAAAARRARPADRRAADRAARRRASAASRPARPDAIAAAAGELQDSNGAADRADHGLGDVRAGLRRGGAAAAGGPGARRSRRRRCWRRRSPAAATVRMPDESGVDVKIGDAELPDASSSRCVEPDGTQLDGAAVHAGSGPGRRGDPGRGRPDRSASSRSPWSSP